MATAATKRRQEHVRAYLMELIQEGAFAGIKAPAGVLAKATAIFGKDLSDVVGSMAQQFGVMGGNKLHAILGEVAGIALGVAVERFLGRKT